MCCSRLAGPLVSLCHSLLHLGENTMLSKIFQRSRRDLDTYQVTISLIELKIRHDEDWPIDELNVAVLTDKKEPLQPPSQGWVKEKDLMVNQWIVPVNLSTQVTMKRERRHGQYTGHYEDVSWTTVVETEKGKVMAMVIFKLNDFIQVRDGSGQKTILLTFEPRDKHVLEATLHATLSWGIRDRGGPVPEDSTDKNTTSLETEHSLDSKSKCKQTAALTQQQQEKHQHRPTRVNDGDDEATASESTSVPSGSDEQKREADPRSLTTLFPPAHKEKSPPRSTTHSLSPPREGKSASLPRKKKSTSSLRGKSLTHPLSSSSAHQVKSASVDRKWKFTPGSRPTSAVSLAADSSDSDDEWERSASALSAVASESSHLQDRRGRLDSDPFKTKKAKESPSLSSVFHTLTGPARSLFRKVSMSASGFKSVEDDIKASKSEATVKRISSMIHLTHKGKGGTPGRLTSHQEGSIGANKTAHRQCQSLLGFPDTEGPEPSLSNSSLPSPPSVDLDDEKYKREWQEAVGYSSEEENLQQAVKPVLNRPVLSPEERQLLERMNAVPVVSGSRALSPYSLSDEKSTTLLVPLPFSPTARKVKVSDSCTLLYP